MFCTLPGLPLLKLYEQRSAFQLGEKIGGPAKGL